MNPEKEPSDNEEHTKNKAVPKDSSLSFRNKGRSSGKTRKTSPNPNDANDDNGFHGLIKGSSSVFSQRSVFDVSTTHVTPETIERSNLQTIPDESLSNFDLSKRKIEVDQMAYLDRYQRYMFGKTESGLLYKRFPAVRFSMNKFRPLFKSSLYPFIEEFMRRHRMVERVAREEDVDLGELLSLAMQPRRNSDTDLPTVQHTRSFHLTHQPKRAAHKSRTATKVVATQDPDVSFAGYSVAGREVSLLDYGESIRGSRFELMAQAQAAREAQIAARRAEREAARRRAEASDDGSRGSLSQRDIKLDVVGRASGKGSKRSGRGSGGGSKKSKLAAHHRMTDEEKQLLDIKELSAEKGGRLSLDDIVNKPGDGDSHQLRDDSDMELKPITGDEFGADSDEDMTPDLTWREYKMMGVLLRMASFENRNLEQMLREDDQAKLKWKQLKEIFFHHREAELRKQNEDKKEPFGHKSTLLGKSVSETSVMSATKMGVTDLAARMAEELSDEGSDDEGRRRKKQANLDNAGPLQGKGLEWSESQGKLIRMQSDASMRSTGGNRWYGLDEKYEGELDEFDDRIRDNFRREKTLQEDRSTYEETDESWEWRKARWDEARKAREAEERRIAFEERRALMLAGMSKAEMRRRGIPIPEDPNKKRKGEDELDLNDPDVVMGPDGKPRRRRRSSADPGFADYTLKPSEVCKDGFVYIPADFDQESWLVASNVKLNVADLVWTRSQLFTPVESQLVVGKGQKGKKKKARADASAIEMSDSERRVEEITAAASMKSVLSSKVERTEPPYYPDVNFDSDAESEDDAEMEDDDDDDSPEAFARRLLRKPFIGMFPAVPLQVKKKKAKAAKPPKRLPLPEAPREFAETLFRYADEVPFEDKFEQMKADMPKAKDPEAAAVKERIRLYEYKQKQKLKKQPWLQGRMAFNKQVCRFGLPVDLKDLESMTPSHYLNQHCYISERRARVYLAAFQNQIDHRKAAAGKGKKSDKDKKKKNDKQKQNTAEGGEDKREAEAAASLAKLTPQQLLTTLSYNESIAGVLEVHHECVSERQMEELYTMLDITAYQVRIESQLFMALCALTERFFFSKFATRDDPRIVTGKEAAERLVIEVTDFSNFKFKMADVRICPALRQLFAVLKEADVQ